MKLYTIFISYKSGNHYCGVHTSLKHIREAIIELVDDIEIDRSEVPALSRISSHLETNDDFWMEFSDSTWIHIQEVSPQLTEIISKKVKEQIYASLK